MSTSVTPVRFGAGLLPAPDTAVLLNRLLRPGTPQSTLSRFRDDRWDLTPGIFESQINAVSLNFALVPAAFRHVAKLYAWMELNYDQDLPILRRASINGRLAVYTMLSHLRNIRSLLDWLDLHEIESLDAVTTEHLDRYLDFIRAAEITHGARCDLLQAVRRLWAFRDLLPPHGRLPEPPPWGGKESRVLLGRSVRHRENSTPRIPEAAMSTLLCWALRMVEDLSADIVAALREFRPLFGLTPGRTGHGSRKPRRARTPGSAGMTGELVALLDGFRRAGRELPGRVLPDGTREPDWPYLAKLLDCDYQQLERPGHHRRAILESGLPVADAAYLTTQPEGLLDGTRWLDRFRYHDFEGLLRVLNTACFIIISYLSGMRPGEVLNLQRGCVSRNPQTGLWEITGRQWKNATDSNGAKIPEGQQRADPWIVIEPVVRAIQVIEQLHDAPRLFPVWILVNGPGRPNGSRSYSSISGDLNAFVDWVNSYCRDHARTDTIPTSEHRLTASQFRRTLAWFICRRPRGLVAAAIQYGHLHVQITQGYAGSYASGFPDDLAFERWLARLDELDEADRRLTHGEHVSGPAADTYRSRVAGGAGRFAGRVIRSGRQARHILANPSLQIHPGKAMACVFNAATALCELLPSTDDARHTPDADDCRPACRNIAYTQNNITELRAQATVLRGLVDDPASPPLRLARERHRLERLTRIITEHENGSTGAQP